MPYCKVPWSRWLAHFWPWSRGVDFENVHFSKNYNMNKFHVILVINSTPQLTPQFDSTTHEPTPQFDSKIFRFHHSWVDSMTLESTPRPLSRFYDSTSRLHNSSIPRLISRLQQDSWFDSMIRELTPRLQKSTPQLFDSTTHKPTSRLMSRLRDS